MASNESPTEEAGHIVSSENVRKQMPKPASTNMKGESPGDDDSDDDDLPGPIFARSGPNCQGEENSSNAQPERIREVVTRRKKHKDCEQLTFLDAILKNEADRKKRRERRQAGRDMQIRSSERSHTCDHDARNRDGERAARNQKVKALMRSRLAFYEHIVISSAQTPRFFKLAHAILDVLLTSYISVDDIDSIDTSIISYPDSFAARHNILTEKFDDLLYIASRSAKECARADTALSLLKWEVDQVLDEERDKHFKWEW